MLDNNMLDNNMEPEEPPPTTHCPHEILLTVAVGLNLRLR